MRKRIVNRETKSSPANEAWLELESLAQVEVSSEEAQHPIEAALVPGASSGWRAAAPGRQIGGLLFDERQNLRMIHLVFEEHEQERRREYTLRWSSGPASLPVKSSDSNIPSALQPRPERWKI